jgi:hypothetical protein
MDMKDARKTKKRPCSNCRRWFQPDPRVAHCQKTCGPACSQELTAKRQADWRGKNPDYDANRRLCAQLREAERPGAIVEIRPSSDPLARVPWRLVQTALGSKMAVVLAFALRLPPRGDQTALQVKIRMSPRSCARLPHHARQTAMEAGP